MRQTSLESYDDIIKKLGERQRIVYNAIIELANTVAFPTDREIAKSLGKGDPNFVRPRRFELMKLGLIVEAGKRPCLVSKKKALTWKPVKEDRT
jgi:hypothetical protein